MGPEHGLGRPVQRPDGVRALVATATLVSPEPQQRATFSGGFNAGRAVGDLGATDTPDILLPAPFQNLQYADEGRLWIFNGDTTAGGGGEQSWNFGDAQRSRAVHRRQLRRRR